MAMEGRFLDLVTFLLLRRFSMEYMHFLYGRAEASFRYRPTEPLRAK